MRSLLLALSLSLACFAPHAGAQQPPLYEQSGDFVATGFHFEDGSSLPQVKLHYVTLGVPRCDGNGHFTNVVLLLHGTTDTGRAFLTAAMHQELFGPGQPLDASRYFIIIPDGLGRGGSSKPSDGLRAKFPSTDTTTSFRRSTCSSRKDWASTICAWCSVRRWAACRRGYGANAIRT